MKRPMFFFAAAVCATMTVAGCSCFDDGKKCSELCQAAMDKAQQVEQACAASARAAESSAQRSEAAARRSEAAADKAEMAFKRHLKK